MKPKVDGNIKFRLVLVPGLVICTKNWPDYLPPKLNLTISRKQINCRFSADKNFIFHIFFTLEMICTLFISFCSNLSPHPPLPKIMKKLYVWKTPKKLITQTKGLAALTMTRHLLDLFAIAFTCHAHTWDVTTYLIYTVHSPARM